MTTETWKADIGSAPHRPHLVLLALPFIWQVGCIPLVNEVALRPLGMPFPMVWQMAGVVTLQTGVPLSPSTGWAG